MPGHAEAALHRLQTKLLDVPAGAKRASREVPSSYLEASTKTHKMQGKSLECYVLSNVSTIPRHENLEIQKCGGCMYCTQCVMVVQVQGALESLKIVTSHLAAWSLPKYVHVTVEPFLRPHADYFSGAAFQARL